MPRVARVVALFVLAGLATAAPAAAFTAPELFVRVQSWDTHEAVTDWIPLASAPQLGDLRGYQVGYRLQPSGVPNEFQRAALTITAVPDGQPTQPHNTPPYCVGKAGTAGTIVEVGSEVQFEGVGAYGVAVSVGPGSGGPSDCLAQPTTRAAFTVSAGVTPARVGDPFVFRAKALPGPFAGLSAPAPAGGTPQTRCALDATVQPDGSVAGRLLAPEDEPSTASMIPERLFPEPGAWMCVSRGAREGVDDSFSTATFTTPWSAPLRLDVHSDLRRARARVTGPRRARPVLTFTAEFPKAAAGGRAALKLGRVVRCRRSAYVQKRIGTFRATFDSKGRAGIAVRRQRRPGWYLGALSIAGSRFYRASTDPTPVLLVVSRKGAIGFADPRAFPRCPGFG